jgi:amino acid adenylation domain-containing protein
MSTSTLDHLLTKLRQRDVQLWLEGDRLRYRAAKNALTPDLLNEVKQHKAEIIEFLRQVSENSSSQIPPIEKLDRSEALPLSFGQQRLWYLHQFEPDSTSNNMPVVVRFTGLLNVPVLEQSLQAVARRHEVLRTQFPAKDDQPTQIIANNIDLTLPVIDLRDVSPDRRDEEALCLATKEARRPFKLANKPILRVLLLQLSDTEHLLVWNMHCIVCDGASSDVFYQDLTALYKAFIEGKPSPLPELPIQYVDFAHWQRQWIRGEVLESQLNYWKKKLEGSLTSIQLPIDHPRPPMVQTYRGDRGARMLPKSLNVSLNSLSQKLGGTLFMTLIAAFETLLHRYSQQNDILISFASGGRGQVETEGLIGFFSNTLIQRINFDGDPTFRELFSRVREASLEAHAHQDLPFEKLVEELPPELSNSRSPLFQVKFALNPPWSNGRGMASVNLPDLNITSLFGYIYHGKTKYDLILVMREQDEGLGMVFDYNADLFEASTIARMLGHLEILLEGIVANPDQKISNLPLLTHSEQQKILHECNTDAVPIPDTCIHQLFESQVQQSPDAIAVVCKDRQLTYKELNNRANQLAHHLQNLGVGSETLVALCVEKSPEMLVGMLGILKAGGAYIPLDPIYPRERRLSKLRDAEVALVLTQAHLSHSLSGYGAALVCLDTDWSKICQQSTENLSSSVTAENLAYAIYTSGSTGEPKGVMIDHRSMVNHSLAVSKLYELAIQDRVLQFANISVDVAIEEIFPTWLCGGTLVIPSSEAYTSANSFLESIEHESVTVLNLPSAFWNRLVDEISLLKQPLPKQLRLVIVGGEKISKSTYQKWRSLVGDFPRWLNAYGPTEATVTATVYDPLNSAEKLHPDSEIPIGRAISNLQTYILDRNLKPSPIGIAGELYIGGVGLSRGYLNRPDISAKQFIPNPFSKNPQDRLYKTGDTVRCLPDGNLEFIGRIDFQIKIQGFRVEPIEIETQLEQYSEVKQAVVLGQDTPVGDKSITAYLVVKDERAFDVETLKSFLRQKLPSYMLPNCFTILDSLPTTINGKVDRRALLDLEAAKQRIGNFVAPRDEVEQKLTNIWKELLGHHDIGIYDNFFELGGNSLLSVRLVAEIEKAFSYNFPLSSFFQIHTISEISDKIREKPSGESVLDEAPPNFSSEDYRALLSHSAGKTGLHLGKRGLIIHILPESQVISHPFIWIGKVEVAKRLKLKQPIYVMPGASLSPSMNSQKDYISTIASLLVDELMTVQTAESYSLGGWCYDGLVAMEVAQQLQKLGKKVDLLVLADVGGRSKIYRLSHHLNFYLGKITFHFFNLSKLSLQEKWQYIIQRTKREETYFKGTKEVDKKQEIEQAVDLLSKAGREYTPKKYTGKVLLVIGIKQIIYGQKDIQYPDLSGLFPCNGWGKLLQGKVCVSKLQCDHLELVEDPHCQEVGDAIQQTLSL